MIERLARAIAFMTRKVLAAFAYTEAGNGAKGAPEERRGGLAGLSSVAEHLCPSGSVPTQVAYGRPAQVGDLAITVDAPTEEARQWVARVTCTNTGARPDGPLCLGFFVVDEGGYVHESFWDYDSPRREFEWGEIAPGATVRGYVGFDVPAGTTPTMVFYGAKMNRYQVAWSARL